MNGLIIVGIVAGAIIGIALIVSIIGSYSVQKNILQEIRSGKGSPAANLASDFAQTAPLMALETPIPNRSEILAIAAPCIAEVMGKDVSGLKIVSLKLVG